MKYRITRSCGHEETVELFGKTDRRKWILSQMEEEPCTKCQEKERQEAFIAWEEEMGLPELKGTEKQIAWARQLRERRLKGLEEVRGRCVADKKSRFENLIDWTAGQEEARFWIDTRDLETFDYIGKYTDEANKTPEQIAYEEEVKQEIASKTKITQPENKTHDTVVTITADDRHIFIASEKDERVREIAKKRGAEWYYDVMAWRYTPWKRWGDVKHIAAEMVHIYLTDGFAVETEDPDIRDMAINGTYTPECRRWIYHDAGKDRVSIYVRGLDTYDEAKKLRGAKYNSGYIEVRAVYYNEIESFAEENGYKFTDEARELLDAERAKVEIVTVAPEPENGTTETEKVDYDALLKELKG